jgi:hypothetical protein
MEAIIAGFVGTFILFIFSIFMISKGRDLWWSDPRNESIAIYHFVVGTIGIIVSAISHWVNVYDLHQVAKLCK